MIFLALFWSFVKIGFTSFGGLSMFPLISREMILHGWMSQSEVADIIAIAEVTPGPLGFNSATYAGFRAAGIVGAIAANLGVLVPCLTLTMVVAIFYERWKNGRLMQRILTGVRPACVGMILGVTLSQAMSNYVPAGGINLRGLLIGAVDIYLLKKRDWSVPAVIGVSAVMGFFLFYLMN